MTVSVRSETRGASSCRSDGICLHSASSRVEVRELEARLTVLPRVLCEHAERLRVGCNVITLSDEASHEDVADARHIRRTKALRAPRRVKSAAAQHCAAECCTCERTFGSAQHVNRVCITHLDTVLELAANICGAPARAPNNGHDEPARPRALPRALPRMLLFPCARIAQSSRTCAWNML
jgi:hypothetical protein